MTASNEKPVLIVGGGIAGISAAVEIAETGHNVVLVEKETYLGGNVIRMNNYFPKLCPPACGLEINFRRIRNNHRIKVFTGTEPINISGEQGNFKVVLKTLPQYVLDTCTSCGKCAEVCPVERPDPFNFSYSSTRAIYLPHPMAFPAKYSIDPDLCKKEACNTCAEVCEYNAIDFSEQVSQTELEVRSVILATGWKNYDASLIENFHYDDYRDVISNVEFERLIAPGGPTGGKLERPSDHKVPDEISFVQCAGSRDENHLPYCSAVCCSASLKHALNISDRYPEIRVRIFYIDLRLNGRNEDFLVKVQGRKNIELIKGKVGEIQPGQDDKLLVVAEDILSGIKNKYLSDLVVLATGIVPDIPGFMISTDKYGFIKKQNNGIFGIACSKKPMDVSSSVKDATAAALRSIQT